MNQWIRKGLECAHQGLQVFEEFKWFDPHFQPVWVFRAVHVTRALFVRFVSRPRSGAMHAHTYRDFSSQGRGVLPLSLGLVSGYPSPAARNLDSGGGGKGKCVIHTRMKMNYSFVIVLRGQRNFVLKNLINFYVDFCIVK